MKDVLGKEHYCFKIHNIINENQCLPPPLSPPLLPSVDNPLYGLPPTLDFDKKIMTSPSMIFQKP